MLPDYGVVVGQYQSYTKNQGQWMHVDLSIMAAAVSYEAAVDVNEPNGLFQYQVFDKLDLGLFAPVLSLPDGWPPFRLKCHIRSNGLRTQPHPSAAVGMLSPVLGILEWDFQN